MRSFVMNPSAKFQFDFHIRINQEINMSSLLKKLTELESYDYKKIYKQTAISAVIQLDSMTLMIDINDSELSLTLPKCETSYREFKTKVNDVYNFLQDFHRSLTDEAMNGWGSFKFIFSKGKNPYFKLRVETPYKIKKADLQLIEPRVNKTTISLTTNTLLISGELEKLVSACNKFI